MNKTPLVEELGSGRESAYEQYLRMFVGDRSVTALIKYECLHSFLAPVPGALGYLLRAKLWPHLLAESGSRCAFGTGVVLRSPGQIRLGSGVMVDDLVVLDAKGEGAEIEVGNKVLIGRKSILSCNAARIRMGDFVSIGPGCLFASRSTVEIGSNVSIGPGVQIIAGGHSMDDPELPVIQQERVSQGISIGDGAWIGARAIVMDGVSVGDNTVIGAGAVVTEGLPAGVVAVGMPARIIRERAPVSS